MKTLENKIPPPIVFVVFAALMWALSHTGYTFELNTFARGAIITLLLVSSLVFIFGGVTSFRKAATTINPLKPEEASSLVTSGIYQITRNPMYVGLTLFLLAWGTYLCSIWSLCCVPIFALYINRFQIMPEERALEKLFGAEFKNYQSKVRRWL